MRNLSSLLERLSKFLNKDELRKQRVLEVIEETTKAKLENKNIFIKEGVLEIEASPVFKNEIRLKETEIKTILKERYAIVIGRVLYR